MTFPQHIQKVRASLLVVQKDVQEMQEHPDNSLMVTKALEVLYATVNYLLLLVDKVVLLS